MAISRGSEVTVKMDYEDLKVGEKYIVASLDILDRVMWLIGHKSPYPPELFCETGGKTENSESLAILQEILETLKEINNKL